MAPLADGCRRRFGLRQRFGRRHDRLDGARIFRKRTLKGREGVKGKVIGSELNQDTRERNYKVQYKDGSQETLTADQVRGRLQIVLKCPRFMLGYHVTEAGNVAKILKDGLQSGTKRRRLRIGKGGYLFVRKRRALKYMERLKNVDWQGTGKVPKLLTCSLRTGGTLFYAGERNYFQAYWVGRSEKVVLGRHYPAMNQPGRFHEMVIRNPKDLRVLQIDDELLGRPFRAKQWLEPLLPKGTELWEYVPSC